MGLFDFEGTEDNFSVIDYSAATETLDTTENGGPSFWDNFTEGVKTATGKITDTAVSSAQNSLATRVQNFFGSKSGTPATSTGHAGIMPTSYKKAIVIFVVIAVLGYFLGWFKFLKRR